MILIKNKIILYKEIIQWRILRNYMLIVNGKIMNNTFKILIYMDYER